MTSRLLLPVLAASLALGLAADAAAPTFFDDDPIRVDPETQDASRVAPVDLSDTYDFVENTFLGHSDSADVRAVNVNTVDEVPDSSWFTNRIGTAEIQSTEDVLRGPYRSAAPQPGPWTIVSGKSEGITPGLTVTDSAGALFFVKFDPPSNPEMATGAEVISTRFFHALGYNVPENHITSLRREDLRIGPDASLRDERGRQRPMTAEDVDALLAKAARHPDGTYRVMASRGLPGTDVGPFRYHGTRPDDPNDIHPHEHRRELRGLRVFAAWLNHDDSRAINTRDFLQKDDEGRTLVRHYLIDFGSTLGSGSTQAQKPRAGNEYIWEARPTFISIVTLGFWVRPWLKVKYPDLPAVGRFEANFFRPEMWKPEYPNPAFDNARPDDLFWAARRVVSFSSDSIHDVVAAAGFTDPEATLYMAQTLVTRRDKIGLLWLNVVLPLADCELSRAGLLTCDNVAVDARAAQPPTGYRIRWARFDNGTGAATAVGGEARSAEPRFEAPAELLASAEFIQAEIRGDHPRHPGWSTPLTLHFRRTAAGWRTVGVQRQPAEDAGGGVLR